MSKIGYTFALMKKVKLRVLTFSIFSIPRGNL